MQGGLRECVGVLYGCCTGAVRVLYGSRFVGWFARVKGVLTLANQPPSRVRFETEILCENSHVIAFRSET